MTDPTERDPGDQTEYPDEDDFIPAPKCEEVPQHGEVPNG